MCRLSLNVEGGDGIWGLYALVYQNLSTSALSRAWSRGLRWGRRHAHVLASLLALPLLALEELGTLNSSLWETGHEAL